MVDVVRIRELPEEAELVSSIKSFGIVGRVVDVHFSPGRQPPTPEQIQDVSDALEDWRANLPETMNRGVEDGTASVWVHLLHLAYKYAISASSRRSY